MSESRPAAIGARFLLERVLSAAQSRVVWGKVSSSVGTQGLRGGDGAAGAGVGTQRWRTGAPGQRAGPDPEGL